MIKTFLSNISNSKGQGVVEYIIGLALVAVTVSAVIAGLTQVIAGEHNAVVDYFRGLGRSGL